MRVAVVRRPAVGHVTEDLCEKQGRCGRPARTYLPIGRGWPRLEANLSFIWRWRGMLEGELVEASRAA
eukprot:scaffold16034_cov30-Phaeocystis_antarctica.AAC.1